MTGTPAMIKSYSYDGRQTISEIKSYLVNTDIPVKAIK